MQRRQFNALTTGALASVMLNPWQQALAQGAAFKAGTDYMALPKPLPTDVAKGKIEVLEFFWYNCPHCNAFEPALSAWSKKLPKDVELKRVPVRFREDFEAQQRAYYVLEALGKVEGVPALGVGGRFYVDGSLAGSMERALQVTDFLLGEIRKGH